MTSGRIFATPRFAASSGVDPEKVIFSGKPRWNVVMPSTPQPDTAPLANPFMLLKYLATMTEWEVENVADYSLCETSCDERDLSPARLFQSCTPPTPPVGPSSQLVSVSVFVRSLALV